jgi:uncharacterized glyoxalase superfamily protein PhnB
MKPTPPDWPRFSSAVFYRDGVAAIEWLCDAFGFEVRLKVLGEDGRLAHSELTYGEGVIMVAEESAAPQARAWKNQLKSPASLAGAGTQSVMFFVDDADAHCRHARSRGARIVEEPATQDYGAEYYADRSYGALDPEGHVWWIAQRLRSPPPR